MTQKMEFKHIFAHFLDTKHHLKVIHVASSSRDCKPNSAAKMLVDVLAPNEILFLDHKYTQTYSNVKEIPTISISVMDDVEFKGYRLTGICTVMDSGKEYENAKKVWARRLITYEADRILQRVKGFHSAREAENSLPKDFVIIKLTATEAAVIQPGRVIKAHRVFTAKPPA